VIRSVKLSLKFCTAKKRAAINAVLREYRAAINFYCRSLWKIPGRLDAETHNRYKTGCLKYDQKNDCLKMALGIVVATKKRARTTKQYSSCPNISGAVCIGSKNAKIEKTKQRGFDNYLRISSLKHGRHLAIPLKSTRVLNKWLAIPEAKLKQGCILHERYMAVFIEIPDKPIKTNGIDLGLDIGYNKLAATSDGKIYGEDFSKVTAIVRRKKWGSKGKGKAIRCRGQYINKAVKSLPWTDMKALVVEDLTGLKENSQRKDKSSKKSRKTMAPWTYRQVLTRIEQLAPENRVRLVYVNPRNTSRRCPACGWVAKENRVKEKFCCVRCHYSADADFVGATNILARMTGNWQDDIVPASSKQGPSREAV
jgi:IS605 OrfB family transposase